ncbi:MAG: DUF3263 domain-containing protein [Actinomycetota bacterium]
MAAGKGTPHLAGDQGEARDPSSAFGERERRILALEHSWWKHAGTKEQIIRGNLGLSAARYYQLLDRIIDMPEALSHDPILVKRLQRIRSFRRRQRVARRLGFHLKDNS